MTGGDEGRCGRGNDGQRAGGGGAHHHEPRHHRLLIPPLRGLRVVPRPLQKQHGPLLLLFFTPFICCHKVKLDLNRKVNRHFSKMHERNITHYMLQELHELDD